MDFAENRGQIQRIIAGKLKYITSNHLTVSASFLRRGAAEPVHSLRAGYY
jgi:hypothetical protein